MCLYLYTSIFTYKCQSLKGWGLYLCPSPPPKQPYRKVFHSASKIKKTTNKPKRKKKTPITQNNNPKDCTQFWTVRLVAQ